MSDKFEQISTKPGFMKLGLILICSKLLDIIFYKKIVKISNIKKIKIKK